MASPGRRAVVVALGGPLGAGAASASGATVPGTVHRTFTGK